MTATDPSPVLPAPKAPSIDHPFERVQSDIDELASIDTGDLTGYLDGLPVVEHRLFLEACQRVADEHRRRADVALRMMDRIRDHLRSAAGHLEPSETEPARALR